MRSTRAKPRWKSFDSDEHSNKQVVTNSPRLEEAAMDRHEKKLKSATSRLERVKKIQGNTQGLSYRKGIILCSSSTLTPAIRLLTPALCCRSLSNSNSQYPTSLVPPLRHSRLLYSTTPLPAAPPLCCPSLHAKVWIKSSVKWEHSHCLYIYIFSVPNLT